jgi:hypothetical protein
MTPKVLAIVALVLTVAALAAVAAPRFHQTSRAGHQERVAGWTWDERISHQR